MTTVLISGAGSAGLTLAHWLHRHGCTPTVVERHPALRPGGQAVDVRGVALDVLDRTGVLAAARARRTRMRGMSMLDGAGREQWRSEEFALSSGRLDSADVEILRDDLGDVLASALPDGVECCWGDSISALTETAGGVRVEFETAPPRTFDLVVGADGQYSRTRRLAFGPHEAYTHHLGALLGVLSTDNFLDLDRWQVWVTSEQVTAVLYPVYDNGRLRATLGFSSGPVAVDHRDVAAQRRLLAEGIAPLTWHADELQAAVRDADDFYFTAMAQIRMDHWTRGRVALVGDAGYCPSPLSGQGTSLALVGAYVLAAELGAAGGDHEQAFARYEERMRPFVAANQALAFSNRSAVTGGGHGDGDEGGGAGDGDEGGGADPGDNPALEAAKNALALDA